MIKASPTEYKRIKMRSKSEAIFARCLDLTCGSGSENEPSFIYEPNTINNQFSLGRSWDFLVFREWNGMRVAILIELKPSLPTDTYIEKVRSIAAADVKRFSACGIAKECELAIVLIHGSAWSKVRSPYAVEVLASSVSLSKQLQSVEKWLGINSKTLESASAYRFDLHAKANANTRSDDLDVPEPIFGPLYFEEAWELLLKQIGWDFEWLNSNPIFDLKIKFPHQNYLAMFEHNNSRLKRVQHLESITESHNDFIVLHDIINDQRVKTDYGGNFYRIGYLHTGCELEGWNSTPLYLSYCDESKSYSIGACEIGFLGFPSAYGITCPQCGGSPMETRPDNQHHCECSEFNDFDPSVFFSEVI